jgi:drug/metabolite transporter (DMT)-like permease
MSPASRRRVGILEILLSGVAFGFLGILGKGVYTLGIRPGELLSLRFVLASLFMALWLAIKGGKRALYLPPVQIGTCALLGLFGYAVFSSCYFRALQGLSASLTVLLLYLYPCLVAVGGWWLMGEKLRGPRQVLSLPLSLLGMLFLVWNDLSVQKAASLVFGLASALFYALYILFSRRALRSTSPWTSAMYIQAFAGLALSLLYLHDFSRVLWIVKDAWLSLLAVSLVSTVLAMALFLSGLQKLRAAEASILSAAEPLTAILAAGMLLGERLLPLQWLGALAVLVALVLVSWRSESPEAKPRIHG